MPVGVNPRAVSFSPSGDRVFVTSAGSGEIHVFSTRDESLIDIYEIAEGARGIAVLSAPVLHETSTYMADSAGLPPRFGIERVYPNPFNAAVRVEFSLDRPIAGSSGASPAVARLEIYNLLGQSVRILVEERMPPGRHVVAWNGRDGAGLPLASGVYVAVLRKGWASSSRKVLLLR